MKIKTFDFEISNLGIYHNENFREPVIQKQLRNITAPDEIDNIISSWIDVTGADVQDIKVNTYIAKTHGNGGGDWVRTRYTILYK